MLLRHNYAYGGLAGFKDKQLISSRGHCTVTKKRYKTAEAIAYKKIKGNGTTYNEGDTPTKRKAIVDKVKYEYVNPAKDIESARLFRQVERIVNTNYEVNKTFRPVHRNNVMGFKTGEVDWSKKADKINLTINEISRVDLNYTRGLSNYKLEEEIGHGAYSIVKSGIQKSIGRRVAIKIYDKSKLSDNQKRNCVNREARILQELNHINIVKLYEMIEMPNELYLIMELVKGHSLNSYIQSKQNKRLIEPECLKIFEQISAGIEYCHSHNVIHRDIKMNNILIDDNQNIKIIDFGFSIVAASSQKLKAYCGTPAYMAPEVIMKESYYGKPADIWSLGVLLFTMLCGTFPFSGNGERELAMAIVKGKYSFNFTLSEEVKQLIGSMLCVDPQRRISAEQVHKTILDMKSVRPRRYSVKYTGGSYDRLAQIRYGY